VYSGLISEASRSGPDAAWWGRRVRGVARAAGAARGADRARQHHPRPPDGTLCEAWLGWLGSEPGGDTTSSSRRRSIPATW